MTGAQEINRQRIRWAGVVTFASIILVFVSDMGLMGLPVSGAELAELGLSAMESRPAGLIYLSSFGAIAILGLSAGGLILYEGLRPIGIRRALPPLLLITAFWWMGCAIHFSYGFIGDAMQVRVQVEEASAEALQMHIDNVVSYLFLPLWLLGIVCLTIGSIWLAVLVLKGETHFPRWYALCVPLFTILVGLGLSLVIPAPLGGYLYPAFIHLGTPITFGVAIFLLRRVGDRNGGVAPT